jgi:hypothetical protein
LQSSRKEIKSFLEAKAGMKERILKERRGGIYTRSPRTRGTIATIGSKYPE